MDWGYNDPCAVLWFAVAPGGRVYAYREYYERRVLSSETARRIRQLTGDEKIAYTVASPDAWQSRGMSASEDRQRHEHRGGVRHGHGGVPLLRADNARIPGWQRVREYLSDGDDGQPRLMIFRTCENLIRTLPALTFDAHFVEDVASNCEDHAPEALRYGLMSRPSATSEPKKPKARAYDPFASRRDACGRIHQIVNGETPRRTQHERNRSRAGKARALRESLRVVSRVSRGVCQRMAAA